MSPASSIGVAARHHPGARSPSSAAMTGLEPDLGFGFGFDSGSGSGFGFGFGFGVPASWDYTMAGSARPPSQVPFRRLPPR